MRRVYYALFVVAVVVLSLWLAVHYDVLTLARAFLAPATRWVAATGRLVSGPLWQRAMLAGRPVLENYLIRRAESPVWAILMDGALALVGYRVVATLFQRMRAGTAYAEKGFVWWRKRHRLVRWGIGSCVLFGAGFFGLGLLVLPMWIPLSGRLLQSVHFFWVDKVLNRWIGPAQRKFRRLMRTNRFWRLARRPYRVVVYWVLVAVRRSARWLRRLFARMWEYEHRIVQR